MPRPYHKKSRNTLPLYGSLSFWKILEGGKCEDTSRSGRGWHPRTSLCSLLLCALLLLLASGSSARAATQNTLQQQTNLQTDAIPVANPDYVYDQLFYMASHFLHREAGFDRQLPPDKNGHDEFANYWTNQMLQNLDGFGAHVKRDTFKGVGWKNRPGPARGVNVEVSIPGAVHPEQVVIIGCHYDGEAVSTQSAYDDASGCAEELGVAKAMSQYWLAHHLYPARTLRFVIFDAEEQGLIGSYHYLNDTVNGDTSNIVLMINEEQTGISYPLRYLGKQSNPQLPLYILAAANLNATSTTQASSWQTSMAQQAVQAIFHYYQSTGKTSLGYYNSQGQEVQSPIFTQEQMRQKMIVVPGGVVGSDEIPFNAANVPTFTFGGNGTQVDNTVPANAQYPFDTKYDTIQLMNTYAHGNTGKSEALALALGLPAMLTSWIINQPALVGSTPMQSVGGRPLAAIGDIGQTVPGRAITFDAYDSFNPTSAQDIFTYHWDFGDGESSGSVSVQHTYATTGDYPLTLTVTSSTGKSTTIRKTLHIAATVRQLNFFISRDFFPDGSGNHMPKDQVIPKLINPVTITTSGPQTITVTSTGPAWWMRAAAGGGILAILAILVLVFSRNSQRIAK